MNTRQAGDKLRHKTFMDGKTNAHKHNIYGHTRHDIDMHDPLDSRTLCKMSTVLVSSARKPKVSKQ